MDSELNPLLPKGAAKPDTSTLAHESRILIVYGLPIVAMNMLRYFIQGATVLAVSRLGVKELAAANLGLLTANIGGYAIIIGLVGALDTLANQASRSESPKLTSLYTMRTFVVCCMAMPVLFLFCFNGRFLFSLALPNADPHMLGMAADYMKIMSLGMPPLAAYECIRRYLSAFGAMAGPTLAYSFATPVAVLLNYLLVHGPDSVCLGFLGAPLATVIAYWVLFLIMLIYALVASPRDTWAGFSWLIFQDLGIVWSYGLASVASTCSEWFAFEFIGIGATLLGETAQASTAIFSTSLSIAWQTPLSVAMAVSIRIGNLLGQNLPRKAARAARAAQVIIMVTVTITAAGFMVIKKGYGRFFTDDEDVIAQVDHAMYVVALITIADGVQGASTGILKGAGRPGSAARINLISYWAIGLPIGAFMTCKTLDIAALWGGLAIAVFFAASLMTYQIYRFQWADLAEEAIDRLRESDEQAGLSQIRLPNDHSDA